MFWIINLISALEIAPGLELFEQYLRKNELMNAQNQIKKLFSAHSDSKIVYKQYINFQIKMGDFEEASKICKVDDKETDTKIKTFKQYFKNVGKNVDKLVGISPFSKRVRIEKIKKLLESDLNKCNKYLSETEGLFKNNSQVLRLRAVYYAYRLRHGDAFDTFLKTGSNFANYYKDYSEKYEKYIKQEYKSSKMKELINNMKKLYSKDAKPSIFKVLLIKSLLFFLKNATDNNEKVSDYGKMLIEIDETDESLFLFAKSLIIEKKMEKAKKIAKKIKKDVYSKTILNLIKTQEEADKKEDEKKKKKQENNEYQRGNQQQYDRGSQQSDNKDPKGYYKLLGVSPSASKKQIKTQYTKLVKENDPDRHQDKNLSEKEKDKMTKKLAMINQARDVLLNPKKRKLYDSGQLDQQNYGQQAHASSEQIKQMMEAFFGGGSHGGRSNQGFFFDTSGGGFNRYGRSQTFFFM